MDLGLVKRDSRAVYAFRVSGKGFAGFDSDLRLSLYPVRPVFSENPAHDKMISLYKSLET